MAWELVPLPELLGLPAVARLFDAQLHREHVPSVAPGNQAVAHSPTLGFEEEH